MQQICSLEHHKHAFFKIEKNERKGKGGDVIYN